MWFMFKYGFSDIFSPLFYTLNIYIVMPNTLISRLFRPEVLALSAYKVADATGFIKLDAMENPYQWSDEIKTQWLESLKTCALNRYPDPAASELNALLKQINQIPDEFSVLLGNGSDEIIQLLLMALPPQACVLAPEPSFVMYKQISISLGLNYHSVPLQADDFSLDMQAMLQAIEDLQPAIIFLAYPNNPSANLFAVADIKQILETTTGLVIIDEAYAPFAEATFMGELGNYTNLLVMRTLSKLGLAGLRLGFIAGHAQIIAQLDKIRLPYNINVLTQASSVFALSQPDLFTAQTQSICQQRTELLTKLNALDGIIAYPSAANFILFRTPKGQADNIFAGLKQRGILIKNLSPQAGLLNDCLRVTVGKPEENQAFFNALVQILKTQ
jgi:histidinol-phosphate aminotransferase